MVLLNRTHCEDGVSGSVPSAASSPCVIALAELTVKRGCPRAAQSYFCTPPLPPNPDGSSNMELHRFPVFAPQLKFPLKLGKNVQP